VLQDGSVFTVGQVITEKKTIEAQIQQAQRMEAVGQLTGGVAHDFNNLLAVIQGNAELLAEKIGSGERSMQAIARAAKRGGELTQRLLAFSRQTPLNPRPIQVADLLDGMNDLLAVSLGASVTLEVVGGDCGCAAMADPGQVENALLNLALNARDAMPEGGKLTIRCANASFGEDNLPTLADGARAEAGDYVMLAVSDTGEGMTPEVIARAFDPFFTTKPVGQGSGLGLSMVYGFARQSGGFATIESVPGEGTTVSLYLPQAQSTTATADTVTSADVPGGQGERVLVVEDDGDVRAFTVEMLEGLGYHVLEAADAAAARQLLDAHGNKGVDLLLSDVVLPGGTSGPRFADEALARLPDLKVIFMSGYPADEHDGQAGEIGGHALLSKPFQRRVLATALRDALG
jgi:nitrogen-specific signal transduction histidine kinase